MNILLLESADLIAPDRARVSGRRFDHIRDILKIAEGDVLRAGIVDGLCGSARVERIGDDFCELSLECRDAPPAKIPLTLVVALPRPQTFKKVLEQATSMGVSAFVFIHTARVEKSFWQSPTLAPDEVKKHLFLGLEQASDTVVPPVSFEPDPGRFFDESLDALIAGKHALIAHPYGAVPLVPMPLSMPSVAAIGPEGGFTDREVALFKNKKFTAVSIGSRIIRVETAVVALSARAYNA